MEIDLVIYRRERDGWIGFATVEDWEGMQSDICMYPDKRTELCQVTNMREAMRLCRLANEKEADV